MNELYDIVKEIPVWVPLGLTGLTVVGMATQAVANVYREIKRANVHFQELQENYRSDFPKKDLVLFYEDLIKNVRPNLIGKKRKIADEMSEDLGKQIVAYSTRETQEAIVNEWSKVVF